jgi:hypothetical protein
MITIHVVSYNGIGCFRAISSANILGQSNKSLIIKRYTDQINLKKILFIPLDPLKSGIFKSHFLEDTISHACI